VRVRVADLGVMGARSLVAVSSGSRDYRVQERTEYRPSRVHFEALTSDLGRPAGARPSPSDG